MALGLSVLAAIFLTAIVGLLTAREISQYRAYRRKRSELYPYSKRRLSLRLAVSALIVTEIWLLLPGHHTLSPRNPTWFSVYVGLVLAFAGAMGALALVDWRESRNLWNLSEHRLLKELLEDLKRGKEPPEVH